MSDIRGIFYNGTCTYQLSPGDQADDTTLITDKKLNHGVTIGGTTLDIYPASQLVHDGHKSQIKPGSRHTAVIELAVNGIVGQRQLRKGEVLVSNQGLWSIMPRAAFNELAAQAA